MSDYRSSKQALDWAKYEASYRDKLLRANIQQDKARREAALHTVKMQKAYLDVLKQKRDLLKDPHDQDRLRVMNMVLKMFEDGPDQALKSYNSAKRDLGKLGYNEDGSWNIEGLPSNVVSAYSSLVGTAKPEKFLTDLVSGEWNHDESRAPAVGRPFSDVWFEKMLEENGLPQLSAGPEAIARAAEVTLDEGQVERLKQFSEMAVGVRKRREDNRDNLLESLQMSHRVVQNPDDILARMAFAYKVANEMFPKQPPIGMDFLAEAEAEEDAFQVSGDLVSQTGRHPYDLLSDPSISPDMFNTGGTDVNQRYVENLRGAQKALVEDPIFRLWLRDRGIKLSEGVLPPPALVNRYARAKRLGKTGRLSRQHKGSGRVVEVELKAGKKFEFGAADHGGAPVYVVNEQGEYVTPEDLDAKYRQQLVGANVIAANVTDVKRGQALGAISTLIDETERAGFEQAMMATLESPEVGPGSQVLLDKENGVVQIVNRLGMIQQSWDFDPGRDRGLFDSIAKQPDVFKVAGNASAMRTGVGGNVIERLTHQKDVTGQMIDGGIGPHIPAGFSLTAVEPTETATVELARTFAGQDPSVAFTAAGEKINLEDIVDVREVGTVGDDAEPPTETGEGGLYEGLDEFKRKRREAGVDRRERRHLRGLQDKADWKVSRVGPTESGVSGDPTETVSTGSGTDVGTRTGPGVDGDEEIGAAGGGAGTRDDGTNIPDVRDGSGRSDVGSRSSGQRSRSGSSDSGSIGSGTPSSGEMYEMDPMLHERSPTTPLGSFPVLPSREEGNQDDEDLQDAIDAARRRRVSLNKVANNIRYT